jgi:hypothetical protein
MYYPFVNRRPQDGVASRMALDYPFSGLTTLRSLKVSAPDLADDDV